MSTHIIDRLPNPLLRSESWRSPRDHHEHSLNAARINAYRARLLTSRCPYADPQSVETRAANGVSVLSALRRLWRRLRLKRMAAIGRQAAAPAALPGNVVALRRGAK
jgi:hypothetical protein